MICGVSCKNEHGQSNAKVKHLWMSNGYIPDGEFSEGANILCVKKPLFCVFMRFCVLVLNAIWDVLCKN